MLLAEEYGALPAEGFDLVLAKLASTVGFTHKKNTHGSLAAAQNHVPPLTLEKSFKWQ
jgi:hypothetical protein